MCRQFGRSLHPPHRPPAPDTTLHSGVMWVTSHQTPPRQRRETSARLEDQYQSHPPPLQFAHILFTKYAFFGKVPVHRRGFGDVRGHTGNHVECSGTWPTRIEYYFSRRPDHCINKYIIFIDLEFRINYCKHWGWLDSWDNMQYEVSTSKNECIALKSL